MGGGIFNPLPGGTVGRTDQGVDISAHPGAPINAIADEELAGVIPNWFSGQPYEWFRILSGPLKGMYDYAAEQINFVTTRVGTRFRGGQKIGTYAPSGTATEFGFADASGRTLASATTGYTEGQATPAGQRYRSQVLAHATGQSAGGKTLSQLWTSNGGPGGSVARIMSAVAMAESSGKIDNVSGPNTDGSYDYGLWQINSKNNSNKARLTSDADYNAQEAVRIYHQQGFHAWTTYNTGAYIPFLGTASNFIPTGQSGSSGGVTRPDGSGGGGSEDNSAAIKQFFTDYIGGKTPGATQTAEQTIPVALQSQGGTTPVGLKVGGVDIPDPLDILSQSVDLVGSTLDFLKWVAWMFNPINLLRVVEFLTGMGTIILGVWVSMNTSRSGGGTGGQTRRELRTVRRRAPQRARSTVRNVKRVAKLVPK